MFGALASCSATAEHESVRSRSVVISAPGFVEEEFAWLTGDFTDSRVGVVFLVDTAEVVDEIRTLSEKGPVALVAFGHDSTPVWEELPAISDVMTSATFVSVPAAQNLEVHLIHDIPILDLHSQLDTRTVSAHQRVHDALSIAGIPHEMVVYDEVESDFFATGRRAYDAETSEDASARIHEWVMTSLSTDDLVEVRR